VGCCQIEFGQRFTRFVKEIEKHRHTSSLKFLDLHFDFSSFRELTKVVEVILPLHLQNLRCISLSVAFDIL